MRSVIRVGVISALTLLLSAGLWAQGFGTIAGTVRDASGAGIPNPDVRARSTETGVVANGAATAEGGYQILQLRPGVYDILVEAKGFKSLQRRGVTVAVADRITLDLSLEVGALADTVTVTAEAPPLRTQDVQSGEVITQTMIQNLPQLGRDPLRLLMLSGNVQGSGERAQSGSDTRINGGRTVGLEYIVDGMTANTGLAHTVVATTPTMESVAEFKVLTNGLSAEYGRLSGGAVEVVTKGGTNAYRGQLFEYLQNEKFNAQSWAQNAQGGKKVHFTHNQFGGVVGGPVWIPKIYDGHNRTFFLFNYDGLRRRQAGSLQVASVPSAAERAGDFSGTVFNGIAPVLYDQNGPVVYDKVKNTWTRQQLIGDGKHIPATMISPVSQAVLKMIPLPNRDPRPGTSSTDNFAGPQASTTNRDLWGVRLDHRFSDRQQFFASYSTSTFAEGFSNWAGAMRTATQTRQKEAMTLTLNDTWTISPTLVANFRAGVNHNPASRGNLLPAGFTNDAIPFDAATKSILGNVNMPQIRLGGSSILSQSAGETVYNSTVYHLNASITKVLSRHTLKYGVQHTRYLDNASASGAGTFSFQAGPVHQTAGVDFGFGSDISNAYSGAAFLIGVNNQANTSGFVTRANALNYWAAYAQDDFRVSSRLTLNLGLRWDMETPITERSDKLYMWDPNAPAPFKVNSGYDFAAAVRAAGLDPASVRTPEWVAKGFPNGGLRIANTPEHPSRTATSYHPWQFAPRIGAAYSLNPKTVLRGSFSQMYISTTGAAGMYGSGGGGVQLSDAADAGWHASNDNLVHMISNWANPYPNPGMVSKYQRTTAVANFQATGPTGPSAFSTETRMPREYTWSFDIQRELPKGFVVTAQYSANAGRGLLGPDIISRFPIDLFSGGSTGANARTYALTQVASPTAGQTLSNSVVGPKQNLGFLEYPYPYFSVMSVLGSNIGTSNYHSMNLKAEKRFSKGLFFTVNYTFSKSLDDVGGPDVGTGAGISSASLGQKYSQSVDPVTKIYGVSPLDETHVIRGVFNFEIPIGRGRRFLNAPGSFGHKVLDFIAGGWQMAGMPSYRSGRPIILSPTTPNINNYLRIEKTYGNFGPNGTNVVDSRFTGMGQVFYSSRDPRAKDAVRRFTNVGDAQTMTYGNLPPIFSRLRQPGRSYYDASLMKAFYFSSERSRYVEFRMEGQNILNMRGFGDYNTTIGTADFGLITTAGYSPRNIQMSARLVF